MYCFTPEKRVDMEAEMTTPLIGTTLENPGARALPSGGWKNEETDFITYEPKI